MRQGIAMMRRTDPENINLPHMLQTLADWIAFSERESLDQARIAEAEKLIVEAKHLFIRHHGENHDATISTDGPSPSSLLLAATLSRLRASGRLCSNATGEPTKAASSTSGRYSIWAK